MKLHVVFVLAVLAVFKICAVSTLTSTPSKVFHYIKYSNIGYKDCPGTGDIKRVDGNLAKCKQECNSLTDCMAVVMSTRYRNQCNLKKESCFGKIISNAYTKFYVKYKGGLKLLGCYRDKRRRDLGGKYFRLGDQNTPVNCVNKCREWGYKFAGLQYSKECYCGNSYGKYGKANNCNMHCRGNKKYICGGSWANTVFVTGFNQQFKDGLVDSRKSELPPTQREVKCHDEFTEVRSMYKENSLDLAKQNVKCDDGYALQNFQFQLIYPFIRYKYKCCSMPLAYNTYEKHTNWNSDGNGALTYLDRQKVDCGENGFLTRFQLESKNRKIRYVYNCMTLKTKNAHSYTGHTWWDFSGTRNPLTWLRKHKPACKQGYYLSGFHVQTYNNKKIRYDYQCAKF